MCIYIYIYIYIFRERDIEIHACIRTNIHTCVYIYICILLGGLGRVVHLLDADAVGHIIYYDLLIVYYDVK